MRMELIPESGQWYKVNMHCHTDISDGRYTPEQIKAHYVAEGYHAVCYTDHEVLVPHTDLCDENFIALHGYEIAIKKEQDKHTGLFMPVYHFNFVAKSQNNLHMPRCYVSNPSMPGHAREWMEKCGQYRDTVDAVAYDPTWISEYLAAVRDAGFLSFYNHPQWSLQNYGDIIGIENLHGIEVINGGCYWLHDCTSIHYEQMLRAGKHLVPVAGDDNHGAHDQGLAWTMLKAPTLTYEALTDALERGDGYATNGPELQSLVLEDDVIRVRCSEATSVTLFTQGRYVKVYYDPDKTYTEVEFAYCPEKFGRYFRVEIRDAKGRTAISSAYDTAAIEEKRKHS